MQPFHDAMVSPVNGFLKNSLPGRQENSDFAARPQAQQDAMFMLWQHALLAQHNQLLVRQYEQFQTLRSQVLATVGAPPGLADVHELPIKSNAIFCWDQSTTCSSSQRSASPGASSAEHVELEQNRTAGDQQDLTTMIIRNVVGHCTRDMLIAFMDEHGFKGKYNLLYLPRCFASQRCFHYAFVNFVSEEVAVDFQACLHGYGDTELFGENVADISLSQCQGLEANIAKYRNSSVMHHSVPNECRPLLFQNGHVVPFPKPTKRIKEDRRARRGAEEA
jgi:hypothetical protein